MAESNESIGQRIREFRELRGFTQLELAKALYVKRETVTQWETGKRDLKTGQIIALSEILNVSCDEILRGIKPENITTTKELGLSELSITCLKLLNTNKLIKNYEKYELLRRFHGEKDTLKFLSEDINDLHVEQYTLLRTLSTILEYEYKSDDGMVNIAECADDDESIKSYDVHIQILSIIRDILNMKYIKDRHVIMDDSGDMNIISAEEAYFNNIGSYAFSAKSIIEARLFEKLRKQILRLRDIDGE